MTSPRGLLDVREFAIPVLVLEETLDNIKVAGAKGLEAMVAWAGIRAANGTIRVTRPIVPRQTSYATAAGLLVYVDGTALFELNRELHGSGELLVGQVHSHAESAYHSETDDHLPVVTLLGALSVVVPGFGRGGLDNIRAWYWARLSGPRQWVDADPSLIVRIV